LRSKFCHGETAYSFANQTKGSVTMWIETHGSGPPLLMVHGWAMHGGVFSGLLECLAPEFCVHVVDLPGHGNSAGQGLALDSCIAELAGYIATLPPVVSIGWSLGGAIAAQLALAAPAQHRGLVVIAGSPRFVCWQTSKQETCEATDLPAWTFGMKAEQFSNFARALDADWAAVVERFLALEVFGSPGAKEELRWLRAQVFARGLPDKQALAAGLQMLNDIDLRRALGGLACPSLWLGGRRDRLVPPRALQAGALLAGGECELLAGAHAPFLTDPAAVAVRIKEFVARNCVNP
jgi:pimeloyl-[acyl-carrier protein] methyl ester esterase